MTDTIFFRLLDGVNRPARLSGAIEGLYAGGETADVYLATPTSLRQVPKSPFAYWTSDTMRRLFTDVEGLKAKVHSAQTGAYTTNDFRFLRTWWEILPRLAARSRANTHHGGRWVPLAKGGSYARFYADYELVIDWANDGEALKQEISEYRGSRGWGYQWSAGLNGYSFYFRPGLTWSARSQRGLSMRVHPEGCLFGHKGPAILSRFETLAPLLAITNSRIFNSLVELQMAFGSYEAGVIQRTPVPDLVDAQATLLADLAIRCVDLERRTDSANEVSHAFSLPALLQSEGATISERVALWETRISDNKGQIAAHQRSIDDVAFRLYSIEDEDRQSIEESLSSAKGLSDDTNETEDKDVNERTASFNGGMLVADLLSYAVGCVFGRWDARIALDPSLAPELADPFAPLPVCSPGMLVGPDGLPASKDGIASEEWMRARPDAITFPTKGSVDSPIIPDSEYPLTVDWDGILVDDPDHTDDVVRRVREVLRLLWGERTDAIEAEACEMFGVKDLRAYFRNPRQFFDHHIKRYSKSRRKAPIYWLLQSPKRSYGLWLYYHRLDPDILFKALTKYVEPKIRLEEGRLEQHQDHRKRAGSAGREAKQLEKDIEQQEALVSDLREFRDRLARAANLNLEPNLNDGVVLNIAPLHQIVPWSETTSKWKELLAGKYEWSSINRQLREKGLV